MKKLAALLLVLLTFAGCLQVDAQDITIRHDAAADRIDILIVHRGLFAEGGNSSERDPLAKALRDLASVKSDGEVVFWNNWPLTFDLTREYPAPAKALLSHVDVENGALFTDPRGQLCGYQFVRIRGAKEFTRKLNLLLDVYVQTLLVNGAPGFGGSHEFDTDTRDLVREFQRAREPLLRLQPGRVEMRLPLSKKDHAWLMGQLEQRLLRNTTNEVLVAASIPDRRTAGGDPTDTRVAANTVTVPGEQLSNRLQRAPTFRFFWDNEGSLLRTAELTTLALGSGDGDTLQIHKASDGLYHDALLVKLREEKEPIEDGVPEQEIARRFAAFQAREAVLPPKVTELRAGKAEGKAAEGK